MSASNMSRGDDENEEEQRRPWLPQLPKVGFLRKHSRQHNHLIDSDNNSKKHCCCCCCNGNNGPVIIPTKERKISRDWPGRSDKYDGFNNSDSKNQQLERMRDGLFIVLGQISLLCLFLIFTTYEDQADASDERNSYIPVMGGFDQEKIRLKKYYLMFQDVHVMVFVGVGFLMTFLRKYGYSAVGFNFLVSALSIQWATLCRGFFEMENGRIHIGITSMLGADFATVAVIISLGAVVGKTTPLQLILMTIVEIALFSVNEWFGLNILQAVDAGGSMFVHVFGAYFGLMVSLGLRRSDNPDYSKEGAEYHSDLFAMIGTLFLWIFWPSFNAALVTGDNQYRAVINTYFSLAACCVTAFAVSSLVAKDNKFNMVHIQNSTLAGGVAVGTACDMMLYPYGALAVGIVAGTLSVLGYHFIQPILHNTLKIHDTCGVHNLHGMPGVLAGLIGALMAGLATETEYGESLYLQFPARAPMNNTNALSDVNEVLMFLEPGKGRTGAQQAGYQLLALLITFIVACVGGLITGILMSRTCGNNVHSKQLFDDEPFWELPDDNPQVETATQKKQNRIEPTNSRNNVDGNNYPSALRRAVTDPVFTLFSIHHDSPIIANSLNSRTTTTNSSKTATNSNTRP